MGIVLVLSCLLFTNLPVSDAGSSCGAGKYCYNGCIGNQCPCQSNDCFQQSFCYVCGYGKYMEADGVDCGAASCISCPGGKYSGSTGLTSWTDCTSCPERTQSAAGSTLISDCLPCKPGTFFDQEFSICTNCSVGTYTSIQGATACSLCEPGSAINIQGATACMQCAAGTYGSSAGLLACSHCPNGSFWTQGDQPCAASGPLLSCPSGELVQPPYAGPADQVWTIAPTRARAVTLTLTAMSGAPGDALWLYACPDAFCTSSALLGAVPGGGGGGPGQWVAGTPVLRLHWVAGSFGKTYGGWRARWISLEGDAVSRHPGQLKEIRPKRR